MNRTDVDDAAIVLYDGFDELDAVGPYEVFANAATATDGLEPRLVTLEPTDRVTASHGLRVEPDGVLGDPDLVLVPGGGWNDGGERGARGEVRRGELPDALRDRHERGATIAAVCTGGMIVAAAGLLDGRPAVTHASALDQLDEYGARAVDARVVDDGDVLTAGGVTSGLDLGLWIVEQVCGEGVAINVADRMEYERPGDVVRSGGSGRRA